MLKSLLAGATALAVTVTAVVPAAAHERSLPVGPCINMGNTFEADYEASWGNGKKIDRADLDRIRAAGFETIRLPVRWHNQSVNEAPYTVDEAYMARVEEVVAQALDAGLNVILNSHHFDPVYEDPLAIQPWHTGVWQQVAARFADYPTDSLWFEIENEPHGNLDDSNLNAVLAPALAAIRATNPDRPVVIGGENYSGIDSLATLNMPDDPHVFPTFHYYSPFDFTHQGASWAGDPPPAVGRAFPTEADREMFARDAAKVQAYIDRTGQVPFMGETGAYDRYIPNADRAAYHRMVREAFGPLGVDSCAWAYTNTFPFWDRSTGEWIPGLRAAFGLPEQATD